MSALECKEKLLSVVDEVAATGEEVVVTRNGRPVGVVQPYIPDPMDPLYRKRALPKRR